MCGHIWLCFIMHIFIKYKKVHQNVKMCTTKKPQPWQIAIFIKFGRLHSWGELWRKKNTQTASVSISAYLTSTIWRVTMNSIQRNYIYRLHIFCERMLMFTVARRPYLQFFHNSLYHFISFLCFWIYFVSFLLELFALLIWHDHIKKFDRRT